MKQISLNTLVINGKLDGVSIGSDKSVLDRMWGKQPYGWSNDVLYCNGIFECQFDDADKLKTIRIKFGEDYLEELKELFGNVDHFLSQDELFYIDLWSMRDVRFIVFNSVFLETEGKCTAQLCNENNVTIVIGYSSSGNNQKRSGLASADNY